MDMEIVIFIGIKRWHQPKCVQQSHGTRICNYDTLWSFLASIIIKTVKQNCM